VSPIARLQQWYLAQCDEDWEHSYGIKIDTLDNPGWIVRIDLTDTPVENAAFTPLVVHRSETDWLDCAVRNAQFHGAGGPLNLEEILVAFLDWADGHRAS
jgi:hypothetical protein